MGGTLLAIGIGTVERGNEFCDHVGFPREMLLCDPDNKAYSALGLRFGAADTFFNPRTPMAIADRLFKPRAEGELGGSADLFDALVRWKPWIPPKLEQGLQQGGMFVFKGGNELFSYFDPSTGAHADLNTVLAVALKELEETKKLGGEC